MSSPKKREYICPPNVLEEELTCVICLNILRDPLTTACCRNTYCSQCIGQCLKSKPSTCPTCRSKITAKRLAKSPLLVTNIISNLKAHCDYHSDGCQTTLTSEQMAKHLTECPFNPKKGFESMNEVEVLDPNVILYPDYAMFGTYKTQPFNIDFSKNGIKLTNVSPNVKAIKYKYHIMIPFIEMQELKYSLDESRDLLLIKPTYISTLKIQESMYLGKESPNGLKFDIKSNDMREQYLIIVLKQKMDPKLFEMINKNSKDVNPDIMFSELSTQSGRDLLKPKTRITSSGPLRSDPNSVALKDVSNK